MFVCFIINYRICLDIIVKIGYNHLVNLTNFSFQRRRKESKLDQRGNLILQFGLQVNEKRERRKFFHWKKQGEGHYTGDSEKSLLNQSDGPIQWERGTHLVTKLSAGTSSAHPGPRLSFFTIKRLVVFIKGDRTTHESFVLLFKRHPEIVKTFKWAPNVSTWTN